MVYLSSELSQHMEQEYHEAKMINSPLVQPPKEIETRESFPKFVPSMENLVAIINSYTYASISKKVSHKIVQKVKIAENLEEEIMEQQVLMENTSVNPMETTTTNRALSKETK